MVKINVTQQTIKYDKKETRVINDHHAFKTAFLVIMIRYLKDISHDNDINGKTC